MNAPCTYKQHGGEHAVQINFHNTDTYLPKQWANHNNLPPQRRCLQQFIHTNEPGRGKRSIDTRPHYLTWIIQFLFTEEFPFKVNLLTGYKLKKRIRVLISQSPGEVYSSVFTEELTKILQDSWAITRYRLPQNTELTWLTFSKSGTKRPKATHHIDRPVQRSWNERVLNVQYKYLCLSYL